MTSGDEITAKAPSSDDVRADLLKLYVDENLQVIRMLMRLGASLPDAEDAVQEAFSDAWSSMAGHPEKWVKVSKPRNWVRAIALNKYKGRFGRRQPIFVPVPELPDKVEDASSGQDDLTAETLDVLKALGNLAPPLRETLTLHMEGFSAPEIAAVLGFSSDQQTRDLIKKARKVLSREIPARVDQERRKP
jgi:DNA-directed RNA polymerase specialized sigma24 family protein